MTGRRETHHVDGTRVYRFTRTERKAHWVNVVSFLLLAVTGGILLFRKQLHLDPGTLADLHRWHLYIGLVYFFGPAAVLITGDWRGGLSWFLSPFRWTLSEILWFLGPLRKFLLPKRSRLLVGRFNAGQRLNLLCQLAGKWTLGITGYFMHVGQGQLLMYEIHLGVFLILLILTLGHLYMGLIHPSTRHARLAMLRGYVNLEWLEHHHPGWLKSLRVEGKSTDASVPPPDPPTPEAEEER